ncbi:ATP-binding protein [Lentibacillus sp. Marseille-P4043]|uniref:ATP-binding protein n=1 Tax=Lentibacillus sp. Marseille-P4043 TaxID=2040293 RepID=UPI000D0B9020|nr:AAA family ATPase [Lentibacillus sp. Marseille-P4043]
MKIIRATIDGFGKWYDTSFDFSTSKLTCLYGENESGKSTLHTFILFILFGLPPKKRAFYRPKTGAKMGGRLTVIDEEFGEYTIERFDEKRNGAAACYTSDGRYFDEAWLKERLNGMTQQTYQSIYSFSAADLAGLKEMDEEDLGDVLLSIGLTGSKNIYAIERRLDTQLADLFKPYGKKPVINQQLATIDDLFASLVTDQKNEATYQEKKEAEHRLTTEIQYIKDHIQQEKMDLSASEKQLQALPLLHQNRHYEQQLAEYPTSIPFPENGLKRMQVLNEQLLPMKSEQSVLIGNQKKYQKNQQQLKADQATGDDYKQAKELLEQSTTYIEAKKELEKCYEDKKKVSMQIEAALNQLNVGITIDDLAAITLPFHIESTWNQLANNTNQFRLEADQLEQEEQIAEKQRNELKKEQEEIDSQLLTDQHVSECTEMVRQYNQYTYRQSMLDDTKRKQQKWQRIKKQKEKSSITMMIASLVLAILCGAIGWLFSNNSLFGITFIFVVAGIGQWLWGKRSIHELEQMLTSEEVPSATHPVITKAQYEKAESLLAMQKDNEAELEKIYDQIKENDVQFIKLTERRNVLDIKEARLQQQINEQYEIYPFLKEIDISYWAQFYHALHDVRKQYAKTEEIDRQCSALHESQQDFQSAMNRFFQEKNWESSHEMNDQLDILETFVSDYQHKRELIEQYDDWIRENIKTQESLKQKMRVYEKKQESLYEAANVTTEEEFFQQATQWEGKQDVLAKLADVNNQLAVFFSQTKWETFNKEVQEQELETKREKHAISIEELEADLDVKRQQLADLNADLANMEMSETYSKTLHRFNMEKEQLESITRNWAVLKTAKELLRETKRDYQDKYVTRVMEKASDYFATITNNAYKQVLAPTGKQLFQVVSVNDIHYMVKELSQGTIDQLYVSLRIAISEVMSKKHHLPFIMDDVFVHFDVCRTERIMEIITEIAKNQQVILFTCKQDQIKTVYQTEIVHLENTVRIS